MMVSYGQPAVPLFYREDNNADSVLPATQEGERVLGQKRTERIRL